MDRIKWRNTLQNITAPAKKKCPISRAGVRLAPWLSRGASGERGSALVETAVVLPIILLLMTGLFSFSIVIYQKLALAEAVSAGARFLAVARGDTDPCASTAAKVYAAAPTLTKSKIKVTFMSATGSSRRPPMRRLWQAHTRCPCPALLRPQYRRLCRTSAPLQVARMPIQIYPRRKSFPVR